MPQALSTTSFVNTQRLAGVNVNLLASDGLSAIEEISGMAHLTGIPDTVIPCADRPDVTSWSGRSNPAPRL